MLVLHRCALEAVQDRYGNHWYDPVSNTKSRSTEKPFGEGLVGVHVTHHRPHDGLGRDTVPAEARQGDLHHHTPAA